MSSPKSYIFAYVWPQTFCFILLPFASPIFLCLQCGWVGGAFALWCNTWFYAVWASGFAWRHKKTGHRADRRHSVSQSNYATILSKTTNSNSRGELIKIHLPGSNQFFLVLVRNKKTTTLFTIRFPPPPLFLIAADECKILKGIQLK